MMISIFGECTYIIDVDISMSMPANGLYIIDVTMLGENFSSIWSLAYLYLPKVVMIVQRSLLISSSFKVNITY